MQPKSLLALAAFATCCHAQSSAQDAVASVDSITKGLSDLKTLVKGVTAETEADAEQPILNAYRDLVNNEVKTPGDKFKGEAFTATEQEQICESLTNSMDQHILLIDAFLDKHDVFSSIYRPVISALLRQDEGAEDTMAFSVINLAPDCKPATQADLVDKFDEAIEKFSA